MSLEVDGVWKGGLWASTVWGAGVWREGEFVSQVVIGVTMHPEIENTLMTIRNEQTEMVPQSESTTMVIK